MPEGRRHKNFGYLSYLRFKSSALFPFKQLFRRHRLVTLSNRQYNVESWPSIEICSMQPTYMPTAQCMCPIGCLYLLLHYLIMSREHAWTALVIVIVWSYWSLPFKRPMETWGAINFFAKIQSYLPQKYYRGSLFRTASTLHQYYRRPTYLPPAAYSHLPYPGYRVEKLRHHPSWLCHKRSVTPSYCWNIRLCSRSKFRAPLLNFHLNFAYDDDYLDTLLSR